MLFNPYILSPVLLISVYLIKSKSKASALINIIIVGLYIFTLFKQGSWPEYGSYYARYVFLALFFISISPNLFRFRKLNWFSKPNGIQCLILLVQIILLSFFFYNFSLAFFAQKEKQENIEIVDIDFPLKNGAFYISQGGTSVFNHHLEQTEKYAVDIVKINNLGRIWKGSFFSPKENSKHIIFGDTIYCPVDGFVRYLNNDSRDHDAGSLEEYFGKKSNYIEIQTSDGTRIVLAHLLFNSIELKVGETVVKGQPIAMVGNSGYSKIPHLHVHAYSTYISKNGIEGKGLALSFNGELVKKNDIIKD